MNMIDAVKTVLGKYATFSGRATRPEFWWYTLFLILLMTVLNIVDGALVAPMLGFERFQPEAGQPVSMIVALGLMIPTIAVSVRRLHDSDRSGWWYLIGLVPIIGTLLLLWWYTRPSSEGSNRFG